MFEITNDIIASKLSGIIRAISNMSEVERKERPTKEFGENYNNIRELFIKKYPDYEKFLPPQVQTRWGGSGHLSNTRYVEIHSYCLEMSNHLENIINLQNIETK